MSQTTDSPDILSTSGLASGRSHFTAGSKLTGNLRVPGVVELHGHVDGTVTADAIVIAESGSVEGELHAADVAVRGQFKGKIKGGVVNLHSGAKVSGEIAYESLSIESGAEVNSACTVRK